jgi:hypothetical protein
MPLISSKGAPRFEQEAPFRADKKRPPGGVGRRLRRDGRGRFRIAPILDLAGGNIDNQLSELICVTRALLAFGTGRHAHLPHGLSELLSNRCHGAIDVDLM